MAVLAVTALPLIAGVLLTGGYLTGQQDALVNLAVLAVLHGAAGWVSWTARTTGWADDLLWAGALVLHTVTYPFNWPLYAGLGGRDGAIEDLAVVLVILIPSLLMFGGPYRAIIRPPEEVANEPGS